MLRKTVAKAFGAGTGDSADVRRAPHETRRENAVERLFQGLLEAFEELEAAPLPAPDEGAGPLEAAEFRLRRPRPRASGVELAIEGPAGALTILNTLGGRILVFDGDSCEGSKGPLETLSVQLCSGVYRPIRRLEHAPGSPPAARRALLGYRFTTVRELAAEYAGRVRAVHKIDIRRKAP